MSQPSNSETESKPVTSLKSEGGICRNFFRSLEWISLRLGRFIPCEFQEVALRVYDKYVPPAAPPPPSVGVIAVAEVPPPTLPAWTTRFFELVQDGEVLPDTFLKYIGTVPFGPEKEPVHIIEVSS